MVWIAAIADEVVDVLQVHPPLFREEIESFAEAS